MSITEREAVIRERAAVVRGLVHFDGTGQGHTRADQLASAWYPLPKVKRPRVVPDPHSPAVRWSVQSHHSKCGWVVTISVSPSSPFAIFPCPGAHYWPTPERCVLWADLLANPTEWVDEGAETGEVTNGS